MPAGGFRGVIIPVKMPIDDCQKLNSPVNPVERIAYLKNQTNVCLKFGPSFGIVRVDQNIVCFESFFSIVSLPFPVNTGKLAETLVLTLHLRLLILLTVASIISAH
ncbi:hypothetical protein BKP64_05385 [Marinobacter salinus]|uniref:Uncharacterized protein n=1 Tax=Marinobacter salinus TaxID=1874317 RepID=A0A1D9GJ61_9GAMM|nr:hypothetical protein BKP64_05385 [Marinobacter salinus]